MLFFFNVTERMIQGQFCMLPLLNCWRISSSVNMYSCVRKHSALSGCLITFGFLCVRSFFKNHSKRPACFVQYWQKELTLSNFLSLLKTQEFQWACLVDVQKCPGQVLTRSLAPAGFFLVFYLEPNGIFHIYIVTLHAQLWRCTLFYHTPYYHEITAVYLYHHCPMSLSVCLPAPWVSYTWIK